MAVPFLPPPANMCVQGLSHCRVRELVSTAGHEKSETRLGVQVKGRGLPADLSLVVRFLNLPETLQEPFLEQLEIQHKQQQDMLEQQQAERRALEQAELARQQELIEEQVKQQQIWIQQQQLLHMQASAAQHNAPGLRTTADEFLPPAEWPGLPSADVAPDTTSPTRDKKSQKGKDKAEELAKKEEEIARRRIEEEEAKRKRESAREEAKRKAQVWRARARAFSLSLSLSRTYVCHTHRQVCQCVFDCVCVCVCVRVCVCVWSACMS